MTRSQKVAFVVAAVVICIVAGWLIVASARAALYGGYRYDGRHECVRSARITLTSAAVAAGRFSHVAVWAGASSPDATAWVQAGVDETADGRPRAYLERLDQGVYTITHLGDATNVAVAVQRRGDVWRVGLGSASYTVRVPNARCFIGAESEDWARLNHLRATITASGAAFEVSL